MNRKSNRPNGESMPRVRRGRVLLLAGVVLCSAFLTAATMHATTASPAQTRGASAVGSAPDKAYGSKSAPITMEVFADYQCPVCRAFYENTVRRMLDDYVASGKVYLIHRDFPLTMHRYSGEAARWANACAEVGEFGLAEGALYDNQDVWAVDGNIGKFIAAALPASDFKRVQLLMKNSPMPAPQASGASLDPMAGIVHPCPVDSHCAGCAEVGLSSARGRHAHIRYHLQRASIFRGPPAASRGPVLRQFFDSLFEAVRIATNLKPRPSPKLIFRCHDLRTRASAPSATPRRYRV